MNIYFDQSIFKLSMVIIMAYVILIQIKLVATYDNNLKANLYIIKESRNNLQHSLTKGAIVTNNNFYISNCVDKALIKLISKVSVKFLSTVSVAIVCSGNKDNKVF